MSLVSHFVATACTFLMAAGRSMRFVEIPNLPASPHQPSEFMYPKQLVWKAHWSFQESWFKEWPLLHYDKAKDAVPVQQLLGRGKYEFQMQ